MKETTPVAGSCFQTDSVYVCKHKVARPTVFIPVFPGTNCEYDSTRAFERAGADVVTKVFRNLSATDIRDSVEEFEKAIAQAQIIMFPGGAGRKREVFCHGIPECKDGRGCEKAFRGKRWSGLGHL